MDSQKLNLRLGVLVSHPIQYYSPWFRDLAKRIDLHVYYAHRQDAVGQASAGFAEQFEWDIPLLDGYTFTWLRNVSRNPGLQTFAGCDTPELKQIISRERFDAFLVIGWNRKSNWQAIRSCWRNRVPVLMRGDSQLPMVTSRIKSIIKAIPYRWFLPRIDVHLYVGERNRQYLSHYGVPDSSLIRCPHFVDNHFFATRGRAAIQDGTVHQLRVRFGIPEDAIVLLFVGKLITKKHPLDFIKALKTASDCQNPVYGIVVGSGSLQSDCRQEAVGCSRIHFAGFQNQTTLPSYYALADAIVLPSDGTETWGLVVNEAMSCGTAAIVSSSCGCSPDLVIPNQTGFLFRHGDLPHLVSQIRSFAQMKNEERSQMKKNAQELIRHYSVHEATAAVEKALAALHGQFKTAQESRTLSDVADE